MNEYIIEWGEFIEQHRDLYNNGIPANEFFDKAIINYNRYIEDNENDWYGYHCRGLAHLFLRDRECAREDLRVSYDLARCSNNHVAQVICGTIMQFLFVIGYADIVEEIMGETLGFSVDEVTLETEDGNVFTVPSFYLYDNYQSMLFYLASRNESNNKGNVAKLPFGSPDKSDADIIQEIETLIGE